MNQNIQEMAKALRDAADMIEKAPKFELSGEVDLDYAMQILRSFKKHDEETKMTICIRLPAYDDSGVKVEYEIDESYKTVAKSEDFAGCLESYVASKETKDSLGAVARLVKKACKESDKNAVDVATETL